MVLALSGGLAFLMLILAVGVIMIYPINKVIKKNNKNKLKQQEMMNELNLMILKHDAKKQELERNERIAANAEHPNPPDSEN